MISIRAISLPAENPKTPIPKTGVNQDSLYNIAYT